MSGIPVCSREMNEKEKQERLMELESQNRDFLMENEQLMIRVKRLEELVIKLTAKLERVDL